MYIFRNSVNSFAFRLPLKPSLGRVVCFLPLFVTEKAFRFSILGSYASVYSAVLDPILCAGLCREKTTAARVCSFSALSHPSALSLINKQYETFRVPPTDPSLWQGREVLWRHNSWSQRRSWTRAIQICSTPQLVLKVRYNSSKFCSMYWKIFYLDMAFCMDEGESRCFKPNSAVERVAVQLLAPEMRS